MENVLFSYKLTHRDRAPFPTLLDRGRLAFRDPPLYQHLLQIETENFSGSSSVISEKIIFSSHSNQTAL